MLRESKTLIVVFGITIVAILFLVFVVAPAVIGIVLLVMAVAKGRKKDSRTKKQVWFQGILGSVLMLPLLISLIYVGSVKFDDWQRNHNSLVYNVNHGNYARVEALLKEGANPDCTLHNLPADEGKKALLSYMCENNGFMDEFDNPVDASLTREEREMMQLLIDYGADVNRVDYDHAKESAVHKTLSEADYDSNTDACGFTPLMYAVRSGDSMTVQFLVENGADVNAADYCGYTPVHIAVSCLDGRSGAYMLEYLIEQGADVTAVTNYGQDVNDLFAQNDMLDRTHMQKVLTDTYKEQKQ